MSDDDHGITVKLLAIRETRAIALRAALAMHGVPMTQQVRDTIDSHVRSIVAQVDVTINADANERDRARAAAKEERARRVRWHPNY